MTTPHTVNMYRKFHQTCTAERQKNPDLLNESPID